MEYGRRPGLPVKTSNHCLLSFCVCRYVYTVSVAQNASGRVEHSLFYSNHCCTGAFCPTVEHFLITLSDRAGSGEIIIIYYTTHFPREDAQYAGLWPRSAHEPCQVSIISINNRPISIDARIPGERRIGRYTEIYDTHWCPLVVIFERKSQGLRGAFSQTIRSPRERFFFFFRNLLVTPPGGDQGFGANSVLLEGFSTDKAL